MDINEITFKFFAQQHEVERLIIEAAQEDMSAEELESMADEQECLEVDRGQDE